MNTVNHELKVIGIGGGTGLSTVATGLKHEVSNLTSIVTRGDTGGSTGEYRKRGYPPFGDARLVSIGHSIQPDANRMNVRTNGHPLGHQLLADLYDAHAPHFQVALDEFGKLLSTRGRVLTVSDTDYDLYLLDGKRVIHGESQIDQATFTTRMPRTLIHPPTAISEAAQNALETADIIYFAPGDYATSINPNLCVRGVTQAIQTNKAARILVIANILNKTGQANGWHVSNYIENIERYLGKDVIDGVIYNNALPDNTTLQEFANYGERPVAIDTAGFKRLKIRQLGADLISICNVDPGDTLTKVPRTRIRHNSEALAKLIVNFDSLATG